MENIKKVGEREAGDVASLSLESRGKRVVRD
jgi:hypothetical protein